MPTVAPTLIRLLDADPDLATALDPDREKGAAASSVVSTFSLGRGRWSIRGDQQDLLLFVVSGVLAKRVVVRGRASTELLGPGDLLCPWGDMGEMALAATQTWRVLEPAWLAVVDDDFLVQMSAWPEVLAALFRRGIRRTRSLNLLLAISQSPLLAERLYLALWHLADQYGYVGAQGVVLPIRLSHTLIAELVAARRPSVSQSLQLLQERGLITRRADRTVLLHGQEPVPVSAIRGQESCGCEDPSAP